MRAIYAAATDRRATTRLGERPALARVRRQAEPDLVAGERDVVRAQAGHGGPASRRIAVAGERRT